MSYQNSNKYILKKNHNIIVEVFWKIFFIFEISYFSLCLFLCRLKVCLINFLLNKQLRSNSSYDEFFSNFFFNEKSFFS